jgi:Flp pilus assembly pilin Flp
MKNILDFRQISAKFYVWMSDRRGVTSIEVGLLVSGISAVVASAGMVCGDELRGMFENLNTVFDPMTEYSGDE